MQELIKSTPAAPTATVSKAPVGFGSVPSSGDIGDKADAVMEASEEAAEEEEAAELLSALMLYARRQGKKEEQKMAKLTAAFDRCTC